MTAFSSLKGERQTRLNFTHGEIVGNMDTFTVADFRTGKSCIYQPKHGTGGHGGGDLGLVRVFVEAVENGQPELLGASVSQILNSHLVVFAAERSRRDGVIINFGGFERQCREEMQTQVLT